MKRRMILLCVVAILLVLTSIASASPKPPKKFRIKGDTTYMDFSAFPFVFTSEGKSIRNIHGAFSMEEHVIPSSPTTFTNTGTLWITTKKGPDWELEFVGSGDLETVVGHFSVVSGPTGYGDMAGTYKGITDQCDLGCVPFEEPECPLTFVDPDCPGFYVDFTFD